MLEISSLPLQLVGERLFPTLQKNVLCRKKESFIGSYKNLTAKVSRVAGEWLGICFSKGLCQKKGAAKIGGELYGPHYTHSF